MKAKTNCNNYSMKKNERFFGYLIKDGGKTGKGGGPYPSHNQVKTVFMTTCQEIDSEDEEETCKNVASLSYYQKDYRTRILPVLILQSIKTARL